MLWAMKDKEHRIIDAPGFRTGVKLAVLLFLLLVFIVPLDMIHSLVRERRNRESQTQRELVDLQGGEQTIVGPLLAVPVTVRTVDDQGRQREEAREVFIMPAGMESRISIEPEVLRRGIYEVPVYRAAVSMSAQFELPPTDELRVNSLLRVDWSDAHLVMGVQGVSGLRSQPAATVNGVSRPVTSSQRGLGWIQAGFAIPVGDAQPGNVYDLDLAFHLNGGGSFHVVPTAWHSSVTMESTWTSPSFTGAMLPSARSLSDDGFQAHWETTSLGMGMPDSWLSTVYALWVNDNPLGVALYQPVDHYQQTTRSVKYGILFVLLPFVALFLLEIFTGTQIHPIQYLMVAAAKTIFYLLMLSLGEHIGFAAAYWVGAAATTLLITAYLFGLVSRKRHAMLLGGMVAAEYLFLFAALQSEDYALLIGSVGLFALLAVVMLITRKINWYRPAAD
jgi:inner membrane protein